MWLAWEYAAIGAAGAVITARWLKNTSQWRNLAAVLQEAAIVAALYALWRLAGRISVVHLEGAMGRGEWLWDLQRAIRVPNEAVWQEMIEPFSWLVQFANIYYGGAHVPGMGIFLVWLFFAHRAEYPPWRNALAWVTGLCLVIQLLPVAPPRLIPELGVTDTGTQYGQSVYATFDPTGAGQLQAMPSIHVAWAVLIGWAVWELASPRWRWVGWFHAAMTSWVVVVTGNHYWADGVVAVVILIAIRFAQRRFSPGLLSR